MKIEKLVIYGYGKWQEKTITLNEQATIILGNNEAGKSTIQSFIKSILFGFPTKRNKLKENTYIPKTNPKQYGGKLIVLDQDNRRLSIERVSTSKKALGEVTIKNEYGETLPEETLQLMLNGLDQEAYDKLFALQLKQLHELTQVHKDKLNRYFLTLGKTGSDLLFEKYDQALVAADKLYRPKGGTLPVNQSLATLAALKEKLDVVKQQQEDYQSVRREVIRLTESIASQQAVENALQQKRQQLQLDGRLYVLYEEYTQLQNMQSSQPSDVPQQAVTTFEFIQSKKAVVREQIQQLQARQQDQTVALTPDMQFLKTEQSYVKALVQSLPQFEHVLKTASDIEFRQSQQEDNLQQELARLGFYQSERLPDVSLKSNDVLVRLLQEQERVSAEIQAHTKTLTHLQEQLVHQQQDKLALKQPQGQPRVVESVSKQEQTWRIATWICGVIALISVIINPVVTGIGLCVTGVLGYQWLTTKRQKQMAQQVFQQDYEQALAAYQERSDQLDVAINQLIAQRQHVLEQLKQCEHEQERLEKDEQTFRENYRISDHMALAQLQDETLDYARQLQQQVQDSHQQLAQLNEQIDAQNQRFELYATALGLQDAIASLPSLAQLRFVVRHFKEKVQDIKVWHAKQEEQQKYVLQNQQDLRQYTQELDHLETQEAELFAQVNVKTRHEFYQVVALQQSAKEQQDKLKTLHQQLAPHLTRLQQYRDQQDVTQQQQQLDNQWHHVQAELNTLRQQEAYQQQRQRHIEEDGTYEELQQAYVSQKESVKEALLTVGTHYTVAQILTEILQANQTSRLEDVLEEMTHILQYVMQQAVRVSFVEETIVLIKQDAVFELSELSQGTLEQVYIAMRLAFMKQLQQIIQLPIIIDDCFVNFDWERRKRMYTYLTEELVHQFIYTTVDQNALDVFQKQRTTVITLEGEK